MASRLTLLYVACTAALLLLAGGFLYWNLKRDLDASRRGLLISKAEVLLGLLRQQPEKADVLADEVQHEASGSHLLKFYIRVLDPRGQILLETAGMRELLPVRLFPAPAAVGARRLRGVERKLPSHRSFVLLSVQGAVGSTGQEIQTLQIGHDFSASAALLAGYRRTLLVVLGLGMVFAGVAGMWVARKGVSPLVEITEAAQRITASHLHDRISGAHWPAELAELASAFDAMLDRLESSFTRLSQFSADLAHALRSPINNLRGEVEVALSRTRTPEEYQQTLASGLEEFERLSRMIDGLLFLARADEPKAAIERVWFDARAELDAVQEFYDALAGEQQVEVICEGNSWVSGEAMLFRRAVSNLLANSLRHTPAGGGICMSLRSLADEAVELRVTDTGTGIAPEHLSRIFDWFYRGDEPASRVPGGSGLGLAIVKSIMHLHGGTAHVQSQLGKGTTVTLCFPAPAEAPVNRRSDDRIVICRSSSCAAARGIVEA